MFTMFIVYCLCICLYLEFRNLMLKVDACSLGAEIWMRRNNVSSAYFDICCTSFKSKHTTICVVQVLKSNLELKVYLQMAAVG